MGAEKKPSTPTGLELNIAETANVQPLGYAESVMIFLRRREKENGASDGGRTHNLLHLTLGFVAVHLEDKIVRLSLAKALTLVSLTFWIFKHPHLHPVRFSEFTSGLLGGLAESPLLPWGIGDRAMRVLLVAIVI